MEENKITLELCQFELQQGSRSPWVGYCIYQDKLKWHWTEYPQTKRFIIV